MHRPSQILAAAAVAVSLAAPAARAAVVYQSDDGRGSTNTGPSFNDTDFLWGNYYSAQPGGGTIGQVQVAFGRVAVGRAVQVLVYDDPDDDGDPRNAVLVGTGDGLVESVNANNADPLDVFVDYDVVALGGDGLPSVTGGFFVAALLSDVDGLFNADTGQSGDAPARRDRDTATGAGWLFFGPLGTGPSDLSAYPVAVNVGSPAVFGGLAGDNLVRAVAVPEPAALAGAGLVAGSLLLRRRVRVNLAE